MTKKLLISVLFFLLLFSSGMLAKKEKAKAKGPPWRRPPTISHNAPSSHPGPSVDIHFIITDDVELAWYTVQDAGEPTNNRTVLVPPGEATIEFTIGRSIFAGLNSILVMAVDNNGNAAKALVEIEGTTEPTIPICGYIPCPFDDDIVVELVWDTPDDPDQTDTGPGAGSDLDLHFRHPYGSWQDPVWDCNPSNLTPDWGVSGANDEDPVMLRADNDGAGPEIVVLKQREDVNYSVGIYYTSDNSYGPSWATVRIFIEGTLVYESTDMMLVIGEFWHVADISSDGLIVPFNDVTTGFPGG